MSGTPKRRLRDRLKQKVFRDSSPQPSIGGTPKASTASPSTSAAQIPLLPTPSSSNVSQAAGQSSGSAVQAAGQAPITVPLPTGQSITPTQLSNNVFQTPGQISSPVSQAAVQMPSSAPLPTGQSTNPVPLAMAQRPGSASAHTNPNLASPGQRTTPASSVTAQSSGSASVQALPMIPPATSLVASQSPSTQNSGPVAPQSAHTSSPPPSPSAQSPATISPSLAPNPNASPMTVVAQRVLQKAQARLSEKDKATIIEYSPKANNDVNAAVLEAYNAAKRKEESFSDKKIRLGFRGYEMDLKVAAKKVVGWLDRFKFFGDVAAGAEPVHFGLPWAAFRIILDVAVADVRQMAAILDGMDTALYMANRLSVYFAALSKLPPSQATENFEDSLVRLYACVLRFLAVGIQTFLKNGVTRFWEAIWKPASLDKFEAECKELNLAAHMDASRCDSEIRISHAAGTSRAVDGIDQWRNNLDQKLLSLDKLQGIDQQLANLSDKIDLTRLLTAPGAAYDSFEEGDFAACLSGTRTQLLQDIKEWAVDVDGKPIFWLCGMAGTGKSTISRTVAKILDKDERCLGASFFFKRGEGDRGSAIRFFPTLAGDLAKKIPGLSHFIAAALQTEPGICHKNLQEQFEKLIMEPLETLGQQGQTQRLRLVIVIDALDECDHVPDARRILRLLGDLDKIPSLRIVMFITSRPELPIELEFKALSHQDIRLEEIQANTIEGDIRSYFEIRLEQIRLEDAEKSHFDTLSADWPGGERIEALVKLAVPLFIFAFTVCRYISEKDPDARLKAVLEGANDVATSGLQGTYGPILKQLLVGKTTKAGKEVIKAFKEVVGSIILLETPLSPNSLAVLLGINLRDVYGCLEDFHSVLSFSSSNRDAHVRLLHLSFRDYLVACDEDGDLSFWINEETTHEKIFRHCIRLLNQPGILKEDLCNVKRPGFKRLHIDEKMLQNSIPPPVAYACCYWIPHLLQARKKIYDDDEVHQFLKTKFVYWMEALSWLGRFTSIVGLIADLVSVVKATKSSELVSFLNDANRFVLRNRHVVDLAPLQLYSSALIFTPTESILRKQFEKEKISWISGKPAVPPKWSAEILQFEGHSGNVHSIALSSDGKLVAAIGDECLTVWQTSTGAALYKFLYWDFSRNPSSLVFSPDGRTLAVKREFVHLINLVNGNAKICLENHKLELSDHDVPDGALTFSRDGLKLATADDRKIYIWDTCTGAKLEILEVENVLAIFFNIEGWLISIDREGNMRSGSTIIGKKLNLEMLPLQFRSNSVFSTDARIFASWKEYHFLRSNDDENHDFVRLWDTTTCELIHEVYGCFFDTHKVAISPDKQSIAIASSDGNLCTRNMSGELVYVFEGHTSAVIDIVFAPDGRSLFSTSLDNTIRLWETGKTMDRLGHGDPVSVLYWSTDGRTIATSDWPPDNSFQLLNRSGETITVLRGHEESVRVVAFSLDGQYIASASDDTTVKLWSVEGQILHTFRGHKKYIVSVIFSPNGEMIASSDIDGIVMLWSLSGEVLNTLYANERKMELAGQVDSSVKFSPDGKIIAGAWAWARPAFSNTLKSWSTATGLLLQTFSTRIPASIAIELTFSPCLGPPIFVTVEQKEWPKNVVSEWNAITGELIHSWKYNRLVDEALERVEFEADGSTLAVFGPQGLMYRIDLGLETNTPLTKYSCPTNSLTLNGQWILYEGEKIFWLPQDYTAGLIAWHGSAIAMGLASGEVAVLEFDIPSLKAMFDDWNISENAGVSRDDLDNGLYMVKPLREPESDDSHSDDHDPAVDTRRSSVTTLESNYANS